MKKLAVLGLSAFWMISLSGCGNTGTSEALFSTELEQTEVAGLQARAAGFGIPEAAAKEPKVPAPGSLDRPPDLMVSAASQKDAIIAGQYGWQWNIAGSSLIACGLHPLDQQSAEDYQTLYVVFPGERLPQLEEEEMRGGIIPVYDLDFGEVPPEALEVRRWPMEYIGEAETHFGDSEQVAVEYSESWMLLPSGEGEYIYEVDASWGQLGSATYVFCTLPRMEGQES